MEVSMEKSADKDKLQYDIDLMLETGWNIDTADIRRAFRLGKKAEELSRMENYENGISMSLILLARCCGLKGEYAEAFDLANQGNEIAIHFGYVKGQIKASYVLGYLYNEMGNLESTLSYYLNGLKLIKESNQEGINCLNNSIQISEKIEADVLQKDICILLAETYEKQGDYKAALNYLKRYNALNEKIITKELNGKLTQRMVEFKAEKTQKDAEIQRLRNVELRRKAEETALKAAIIEESHQNTKIIGEIVQKITATLNIEKVLNLVYESIHKLMDADLFGICLYDEVERSINFKILMEESKPLPLYQISIDNEKSYAAQCIRTKKEIILNDLIVDEKLLYRKEGRPDIKPKSIIYYPLIIEDKVVGAMTVQSYRSNAYTDRNKEIIRALASYMAIALNNSQKSEELKAKTSELEYLSQTDMLTGLYNRRYIIRKLEAECVRYQRNQRVFSIVMLDIDHFKRINDIHGHDCGDHILVGVTQVLKSLLRKQDVLARWGGEEFLMLLPDTKGEEAVSLCECFRQTIEEKRFVYKEKRVQVTITLGVEECSQNLSIDSIINSTDKALYEGKNKGRNCVVLR